MTAYFVGEVEVHDDSVFERYALGVASLLEEFGAEVLVKGGETVPLEGKPPSPRVVIVRFPSRDIATKFINSPAFQRLAEIRRGCATARAFLVDAYNDEDTR